MLKELLKNQKLKYLFLISILVIGIEILGLANIHLPQIAEIPLFISVIILIGRKVIFNGFQALVARKFSNINLLMTIAIIGAVLIGELEEAAVIVALFSLGEALEDFGIERSRNAIDELVNNSPKQITLKSGENINVEDVKIDDIFIVKPGEQIGLDGTVISGRASVDEASITGESIPNEKIEGSLVYAGTTNVNGYLEINVLKEAKDSTLQKIAALTQNALANKAEYQKFIEKFSKYYTPGVLILSILIFLIPGLITGNFMEWFERAITILVIACPCALVISTPVSIFSSIGNASSKGILIKGGRFLEQLGDINIIAFDKTRTLTFGKPIVEDVLNYFHTTKEEILSCAAGIEKHSEHPLAGAIIEYADKNNLKMHDYKDFHSVAGKGIRGDCLICKAGEHVLGNLQIMIDNNKHISKEVINDIRNVQSAGKTPIILADTEGIKGIIVVADEIRPQSARLIEKLKRLKVRFVILTGDNQKTANFVGKLLNIDEVYGDLLPEGKIEKIKELKDKYGSVAMVGDGVNDAPSLSLSNVGIAMGAVGSDVAIESADIALMNDKIELIPFLIQLGRKTQFTIQTNIGIALITKLIALLLSITGSINLAIAIFADVGVTFLVIILSLRLLNFKENK